MSKFSFNVDERGISILMEPEEAESESCDEIALQDSGPSHFVDKYGNIWTAQPLTDLAFRQMIRRLNRVK